MPVTTRKLHVIARELFWNRDDGITVPTIPGVNVPPSGYVVAVPRVGHLLSYTDRTDAGQVVLALQEIELWLGDVLGRAAFSRQFVGVWSDGDLTYLDVVEILPERAVAIQTAKDRGELCIFDLAAKAEIRVPEPAYADGHAWAAPALTF